MVLEETILPSAAFEYVFGRGNTPDSVVMLVSNIFHVTRRRVCKFHKELCGRYCSK